MRRHTVLAVVLVTGLIAATGAVARECGDRVLQATGGGWHLDIDAAMDAVGVAPGQIVGEAGAGDGYFTLPMARRVGPKGAVLANDISRRALGSLASRARQDGLSNVQTVEGVVDDPLFPRKDLDLIVVVHAFHDFDRPVEWLVNARKYLRPGGTVAIIDRDPEQGAESHFWTRARILAHAASAGYAMTKSADVPAAHLVIVLAPAPGDPLDPL